MTDQALTVACTYCDAKINEPCRNTRTGKPLTFAPAHTCRVKLAEAETEVPF